MMFVVSVIDVYFYENNREKRLRRTDVFGR